MRSLPGVPTRFENVDLVIIRENTEGLYSGVENEVTPGVVMSMKVATEKGCQRIAQWAFRYATRRQRRSITVFHKANIMVSVQPPPPGRARINLLYSKEIGHHNEKQT